MTYQEEDGAIVDNKLCKSALPLMFTKGSGTWCSKSSKVCVKVYGEKCQEEEVIEVTPVV